MEMLRLVGALLLLLPLGGCASSGDPHENTVARSFGPFVSQDYDYEGKGAKRAGFLNIATSDITNQGTVSGQWGQGDSGAYRINWATFFAPDFLTPSDGAIVRDRDLNGDASDGSPLLPRVQAISAGWGEAQLILNNETFLDPLTGREGFRAHYILARDAIRDPVSYKILKTDGMTPYDPASPDDVRLRPGVPQILLLLESNATARLATSVSLRDLNIAANNQGREILLPVPMGQERLTLYANVTTPAPPAPVPGQVTLTVLNTGGKPHGSPAVLGGTQQLRSATIQAPEPEAGDWLLRIQEQGAGFSYGVQVYAFDDGRPWFRLLTFDEPFVEHEGQIAESERG